MSEIEITIAIVVLEIGIALLVLVAVYLGVRSDRMENKAIQAGDSEAFNKRVRTLMQEHSYSEEKARAAAQRIKNSSRRYGSAIPKIDAFLWKIGGLAVLGFFVWVFLPVKTKYSLEYGVDSSNVIVEDKPHKCDWETAPLGAKNCHYEKDVTVTKDSAGKNTNVYVTWNRKED